MSHHLKTAFPTRFPLLSNPYEAALRENAPGLQLYCCCLRTSSHHPKPHRFGSFIEETKQVQLLLCSAKEEVGSWPSVVPVEVVFQGWHDLSSL